MIKINSIKTDGSSYATYHILLKENNDEFTFTSPFQSDKGYIASVAVDGQRADNILFSVSSISSDIGFIHKGYIKDKEGHEFDIRTNQYMKIKREGWSDGDISCFLHITKC